MATAFGAHVGPWTEADIVALPEDGQRYELMEGALLVNPPPGGLHQIVSWELTAQLKVGCPTELVVVEAMGVRLPDNTVLVPDVLIAEREAVVGNSSGILDPAVVLLVAEIVSPGSRTADRFAKPALYAAGRISSFWRIELQDGPVVIAYLLQGDEYVEVASAVPGERLTTDRPYPIALDPRSLNP